MKFFKFIKVDNIIFSDDKMINPIIKKNSKIGFADAVADKDILFSCFIEKDEVQSILDKDNNYKFFIIKGRTGSGKTALLQYIKKHNEETTYSIDLTNFSMNYFVNSDIFKFLNDIKADLSVLFQILWKHVLCLEFIRIKFKIDDENRLNTFIERLTSLFPGKKKYKKQKEIATNYIKEWGDNFWQSSDDNVTEVIRGYEDKISAYLKKNVSKFIKAGGNVAAQISQKEKKEITQRVKEIINGKQLSDLQKLIDITAQASDKDKIIFFILIDNLDTDWSDESIRFRMIRALLDTLSKFIEIKNLRICVAIRDDILERTLYETQNISFQREKIDDFVLDLKWNKNELRDLVETRITYLYKKQYSKENVTFVDIFCKQIAGKNTFDYLIERTFMRPRDIIVFINECLLAASKNNSVIISSNDIKEVAEKEYSRKRLDSVYQEWFSVYPELRKIVNHVLYKKSKRFKIKSLYLDNKRFDNFVLELAEEKNKIVNTEIFYIARRYCDSNARELDKIRFCCEICACLYRVGIIGIKIASDESLNYAHINRPIVDYNELNEDMFVSIHPMFYSVLGINSKEKK